MSPDRHQDLHSASEAELHASGGRTPRGEADDAEISREIADATAESRDRGDTPGRLAEWREAERAIDDSDPDTVEGEELRDDAAKAHDAYTAAEHAQADRHRSSDDRQKT